MRSGSVAELFSNGPAGSLACMAEQIPFTYRRKLASGIKTYVRAEHLGRTRRVPFENEWLVERGFRAVSDPIKRAQRIHALLLDELKAADLTGPTASAPVSAAVQQFLAIQEELPESRRPCRTARFRRCSVLRDGTVRRRSLVQFLDDRPVGEIGPDDLLEFEKMLDSAGYARESVRSYMTDVVRFFSWAVEAEVIARSPARKGGYQLPVGGSLEPEGVAYTPLEMKVLAAAVKAHPGMHRMFLVISQTGVRRGEYLRLQREHWQGDVVHVPGARKNKARIIDYRPVPVTPALSAALRDMKLKDGDYIASGRSVPVKCPTLQSWIRRFHRSAGLLVLPQRLRRTYEQRLEDTRVPEETIVKILGHSIRTKRRWYTMPAAPVLPSSAIRAVKI